MKKLLGLLGVFGLSASISTSVVACGVPNDYLVEYKNLSDLNKSWNKKKFNTISTQIILNDEGEYLESDKARDAIKKEILNIAGYTINNPNSENFKKLIASNPEVKFNILNNDTKAEDEFDKVLENIKSIQSETKPKEPEEKSGGSEGETNDELENLNKNNLIFNDEKITKSYFLITLPKSDNSPEEKTNYLKINFTNLPYKYKSDGDKNNISVDSKKLNILKKEWDKAALELRKNIVNNFVNSIKFYNTDLKYIDFINENYEVENVTKIIFKEIAEKLLAGSNISNVPIKLYGEKEIVFNILYKV